MAASSKKRRASRSPSHSVAARKKERRSTDKSVHSQREFSVSQASRAKSIFRGHSDPYFPPNNKGTAALPTSDDYVFRVQVVSTTVDVSTDVFKKAVQGLVKICFPQDVLEEIGIEVVTQHMRNEGALEQKIVKMTDIFRSEMIHRVNWMLAEYLDTPEKVEASVEAIIAASASLHGAKIGDDILSHVLAGLQSLRERIPDSSTERPANGTDIDTMDHNLHEHSSPQSNTDDSGTEHAIRATHEDANQSQYGRRPSQTLPNLNTKDKRRQHNEVDKETGAVDEVHDQNQDSVSSEIANDDTTKTQRDGKVSRISTSWRWDIRKSQPFEQALAQFHRMSDLFAYHALPIVKQRLGQKAHRKQLRQEMERLLVDMPNEQFARWTDSFQKLKSGDSKMLERCVSTPSFSRHSSSSGTPAPLFERNDLLDCPIFLRQESVKGTEGAAIPRSGIPNASRDSGIRPVIISSADTLSQKASSSKLTSSLARETQQHCRTPIIDLLWDTAGIDKGAIPSVTPVIVSRLNQRVAAQSIGVQRLDGSTQIVTKKTLKNNLLSIPEDNCFHVRRKIEFLLIPWVVAKPSAFPELLSEPFLFASIIPDCSTVLDLLCDPKLPITMGNISVAKSRIFAALSRREISILLRSGPQSVPLNHQIGRILAQSQHEDVIKRGCLERVLRYTAFDHREKFPELKSSVLGETWEQETGKKW